MEELIKRIESYLDQNIWPAFALDKVNLEEKIIYMYSKRNIEACMKQASELLAIMPEFAAVVFDFNGTNKLITSQMTPQEGMSVFFEEAYLSRISSEVSFAEVRKNLEDYSRISPRLKQIIFESPEGIKAGEKYDEAVAESEKILKEIKPLEVAMDPQKQEYEAYLKKIKEIKKQAKAYLSSIDQEFQTTIYNLYSQTAADERYYLYRVSSECRFSEIRKNPDNFSRITPALKYVLLEMPEGIIAGEKYDLGYAKYLEMLESINSIKAEMKPSEEVVHKYTEQIDEIKARAKAVVDSAATEYNKTIHDCYQEQIDLENLKRLKDAQEILANTKTNEDEE